MDSLHKGPVFQKACPCQAIMNSAYHVGATDIFLFMDLFNGSDCLVDDSVCSDVVETFDISGVIYVEIRMRNRAWFSGGHSQDYQTDTL